MSENNSKLLTISVMLPEPWVDEMDIEISEARDKGEVCSRSDIIRKLLAKRFAKTK